MIVYGINNFSKKYFLVLIKICKLFATFAAIKLKQIIYMQVFSPISKLQTLLAVCAFGSFMVISCVDKDADYSRPDGGSTPNPFMYNTTQEVDINVNYELPASDYQIRFEIYLENPFKRDADGQVVKRTDVEPKVIRMTDGNGHYSGKEIIPGYLLADGQEVYIYTSYIGVPNLYKATLQGGTIQAEINWDTMYDLTSTRVVSRAGSVSGNLQKLGEWDMKGRPAYLDAEGELTLSKSMLSTINKVIPEGGTCDKKYRQSADFLVSEAANIKVRFVGGTSSAASAFGYYCYKEGASTSKIKNAKKYIVFPNTKTGQAIKGGECVQLHYIDENGEDKGTAFPAGVKIGWFLSNDAFGNGDVGAGKGMFYSTTALNTDTRTHTAAFKINDFIVLSFEDWTDYDYNDVMFNVWSDPIKAIVTPDIPDVTPENPDNDTYQMTYKGIVAFEDNWPSKGDYDLNDVIVKYNSVLTYNTKNEVISTEDTYTALWSGAVYQNSFMYQMNTDRSNVLCTKDGKPYSLDEDLSLATIPVFTDVKEATGNNTKTTIVAINNKFNTPIDHEIFGAAPYNPFISIYKRTDYNRAEVHLVNHKPTEKANQSLFHTKADLSDWDKGIFYVSDSKYPFAIDLADAEDFSTTEKEEIDKTYPRFASWVESNGTKDKDWYLKK